MSAYTPLAPARRSTTGRILTWTSGIVSFSILAYLILVIAHQFAVPPPAHRLVIVQDVPLPDGLAKNAQDATSLAPGVELQFDAFDFQAYDAPTHRLFIARTGPNPDDMTLNRIPFDPKYDGNVVVLDTVQTKVIGRVAAPQVSGIIDAPDLHKVFAADSQDNILYDINVNTMQIEGQIQLPDLDGPDAIGYDPVDHRIFVSDTGSPADVTKTGNVDRKNENIAVIDALHDKLLGLVNFGFLPLLGGEQAPVTQPGNIPTYGHDVGHNDYDLGHDYVTSQIAANADSPNAYILPPPHTAEFIAINALTMKIDKRIVLPAYCSTPHGMNIDREQHVAFVACTDFNPQAGLFANLLRVDLRTMTVIPTDPATVRLGEGPDLVRVDLSAHLLFVACGGGVTIFDEKSGEFHRLGLNFVARGAHSIAINEQTQQMYFPIFAGGLPLLRVTRYNPFGV
ncbi:MAG: hypothetical protein ABI456_11635 [Ktedonobacteraceae bacterium]|nr:hypothetical protein [Chloroflexota bacterium]